MPRMPLIGLTTYRKTAEQLPPIELYGLMPAYVEAVTAAGGLPVLIPLGLGATELAQILERVDGLLLPGGGDIVPETYGGETLENMYGFDANRDRVEMTLAREAVAAGKPLLAICRGHQLLNVALGGTLWEDIETRMPGARRHNYYLSHPRDLLAHEVTVSPGSLLSRQLGCDTIAVNSLHHQGVRKLAPGLKAVARAEDGLVEASEVIDHPFALSVQWHPENLLTAEPRMRRLFEGLVEAALAQKVLV